MTPQNKSKLEITQTVWSLVDALPHRGGILESDARAWVEEVVALHGEAAIWHAIRLNGFGGSEIGVLVRNRAGQRADHQASAHDIVAGKLMRKIPSESSAHMTRGHENEEPHAQRFYQKYGASRDLASFEALKSAQGKRPWMRYSPDDLVLMPVELLPDGSGGFYPSMRGDSKRRWLLDYKAPSKVEQSDEIAFQYACQLTQGAILCAESGIELDGMMLSQFDWANWALKDDVIMWDESIGRQVLDAGEFYWQHVTAGTVPDYISTREAKDLADYARDKLTPAEMYANLVSLSDAAKKRAEEIKSMIVQPIKGLRLAGQKVSFGLAGAPVLKLTAKQMLDRDATRQVFTEEQLAKCSGKAEYDPELMAGYMRANNIPLLPFKKFDLDATKVYAMATGIGLDADALVVEQLVLQAAPEIKARMGTYIDQHYPLSAASAAAEPQEETPAETYEAPAG